MRENLPGTSQRRDVARHGRTRLDQAFDRPVAVVSAKQEGVLPMWHKDRRGVNASRLLIAVLAMASMLVACGDDDEADTASTTTEAAESTEGDADAELEELVEAAKAEGELVWYTSTPDDTGVAVIEAFEQKYGISIEYTRGSSSDLRQRYSAEASAGSVAADVILMADHAFFDDALGEGWLVDPADWDVPGADEFPQESVKDEKYVVKVDPMVLGYNTDEVSEDKLPESWEDVLDPEWKGRILIPDPRSSAIYMQFFDLLRQTYGDEFLTGLAEQDVRVFQSGSPLSESLAAGEGAIALPVISALMLGPANQGAPLDFKVLEDVTTGAEQTFGISKDARHPNAARLFAHFLLSEEGSLVLNEKPGEISPFGDEEFPEKFESPDPAWLDNEATIIELLGLS